ncbi:hypothetical protein HID58_053025 [Brassica napus]|uniref:Uncharacterized protein n=1 Tax=Brassica napus TaxID=3708 RepID=A0ABQ8ADM4_BRANA|nr:hypothetical protein HID58_053025 [Brassica napus]
MVENTIKILRIKNGYKLSRSSSFRFSPTPIQLPVIYFLDETLTPGTSKWDKVNADVREALEQFGCFEVSLTKSCQWSLISLFSKPWKSFSIFPLRPNRETCCGNPIMNV